MTFIKAFSISLIAFVILDFIWFRIVKNFNLRELAEIGRMNDGQFDVLIIPALVTYVLMALAVAIFIAPHFTEFDPWWRTFLVGAVMGLIIYGIFDLTNLAILKNYPIKFMIVDMSWGTFVFGLVSCLSRYLLNRIG